jgi:serine/threonine-protein kinase PRP4
MYKRATPVEARDVSRQYAKTDKGATVERGINNLAISKTRYDPPGCPLVSAVLTLGL